MSTNPARGVMPLRGVLCLCGWLLAFQPANGKPIPEDDTSLRMSAMGQLAREGQQQLREANYFTSSGEEETEIPCLVELLEGIAGGQAETSIAVDATGLHVVVGFNDTRGGVLNPISVSGFAFSDDGGQTFTDGGQLPAPVDTVIGTQSFPQVFGDPEIEYLGGCTFLYSSIMRKAISATTTVQTMGVHRSTDCGHSWSGPFEVPPASNPNGGFNGSGIPLDFADKEFMDVDPETGRVLMVWSNFTPMAVSGVEISAAFSDDAATATPPTWSLRSVVAARAEDGQSAVPQFAGDGSDDAYVAWESRPPGGMRNVGFAKSSDNGQSWSAPVNLTANFRNMDQVLGNDRIATFPDLAVDRSGGPDSGNIYLVYANNDALDGADIMFQRSLDGGANFSPPVALGPRPGLDRVQWFPAVTVDSDTGRVWVMYYDQSVAAAGDLMETVALSSDDGGVTWSPPFALSPHPFHTGHGNDSGQPNLGDYNQLVAQDGEVFAVWAQTAQRDYTDGLPSTSMTTPDFAFTRVAELSPRLPVRLGAESLADTGADGFIDVGDEIELNIPLVNFAQSSVFAGTLTNVTATLVIAVAGVVVLDATATYGSIPAGATGVSSEPFRVQVGYDFPVGLKFDWRLDVTADQGATTLRHSMSTGTPVETMIFAENFNGVGPGSLPAGWASIHQTGQLVVPWTTNNSFCGTGSNAAFHSEDGGFFSTRHERLSTPTIPIPPESEFVIAEFDVCYNTEDESALRVQAYDGFFLRVSDFQGTTNLRSVLAEAFAEEFTTGGVAHYPKHLPRSTDTAYFQDMSAWAGDSQGFQHVRMKLPGMAARTVRLRFEYTQDATLTCADVRPGAVCGVMMDNMTLHSFRTTVPADVNRDLMVDLNDFAPLAACLTGPSNPLSPGCAAVDFVADGHVDLRDVSTATLQFGWP